MSVRIITGDCREVLSTLPAESVHCVVTSPPYWGLRDYGVDGQLGMEASLGEHVETIVGVFREVWRVLRKDGTLWLNYGDSYAASPNGLSAADVKALGRDDRTFRDKPFSTIGPVYDPTGGAKGGGRRGENKGGAQGTPEGRICAGGYLKPKDLCGIPWRVALALQADGWWLRQDIIWSKPNPMPESVTDRCTKAHEYLFLLTKAERYYFDQDAIKEAMVAQPHAPGNKSSGRLGANGKTDNCVHQSDRVWGNGTRNKRSVWEVATQPFSDAHFATFPPALIEPCILAGCPQCGTVLDPFFGAGTTGLVADRLQRSCIGIELNPAYADMARKRIVGDAPLFVAAE